MSAPNLDALAEQAYAAYDPQFADPNEEEREDQRAALEEVIELIEKTVAELKALKKNFTTRKYNRIINALEEIGEEVREAKEDV